MHLNLNHMLDTMSKGAIMEAIEVEVDRAIALRVEEEARKEKERLRQFHRAIERVLLDTYSQDDLVTLQEHLDEREDAAKPKQKPLTPFAPFSDADFFLSPNKNKVVSTKELEEIMKNIQGAIEL